MTEIEKQNARITFSGRFIYRENGGVSRHVHRDYQLMRIVSGQGVNTTDGEQFPVKEGDIVLVKAGSSHEFTASSPDGMKTLEMKFIGESRFLDTYIGSIPFVIQDTRSAVFTLLSRIILEGQRKIPMYHEMSNVLLRECLIVLHRIQGGTIHDSPMFAGSPGLAVLPDTSESAAAAEYTPAVESASLGVMTIVNNYIQQHIAAPFTVEQLADSCGYSRDYVYRAVKKQTGMSLAAYINTMRFEKAKKMLEFSELSVSETAYNLGFSSIQYFSRFFSRMAGISPSSYLNQKRINVRIDY